MQPNSTDSLVSLHNIFITFKLKFYCFSHKAFKSTFKALFTVLQYSLSLYGKKLCEHSVVFHRREKFTFVTTQDRDLYIFR